MLRDFRHASLGGETQIGFAERIERLPVPRAAKRVSKKMMDGRPLLRGGILLLTVPGVGGDAGCAQDGIPAPEHLEYTKHCNVGIANYDISSLNNIFCAPNKIYEYAKFGIPMLCSKNVALEETVGAYNAGICVDFNDIKELKRAIEKVKEEYAIYTKNAVSFYQGTDVKELIRGAIDS